MPAQDILRQIATTDPAELAAAADALDKLPALEAAIAGLEHSRDDLAAQVVDLRSKLEERPLPVSAKDYGTVDLDSFPGKTDEDKLTPALAQIAGESYKRAIRLPAGRIVGPFTQTRKTFPGLKFVGPSDVGWQNVEQGGGVLNQTRVRVNTGIGANSWWVGSGQVFNVLFANFACESTNGNSQFIHHPVSSGTLYGSTFDSLGFQAFKHVLGNPADPLALTLCDTSGRWNMTTALGRQIDVAGSDNDLWVGGRCNIGPSGNGKSSGKGEYLVSLRTGKTNYGGIYITADDQWRALLLQGDSRYQMGNRLHGFRIEGRNAGDASPGALVKVTGGGWDMTGFDLNYAMANPGAYTEADRGYIHQTGGMLHADGITVDRASGVAETVPIVYVSGGETIVRSVKRGTKGGAWTRRPVVAQTRDGLVVDSDPTVEVVTLAV
jgi:hypothetical protein